MKRVMQILLCSILMNCVSTCVAGTDDLYFVIEHMVSVLKEQNKEKELLQLQELLHAEQQIIDSLLNHDLCEFNHVSFSRNWLYEQSDMSVISIYKIIREYITDSNAFFDCITSKVVTAKSHAFDVSATERNQFLLSSKQRLDSCYSVFDFKC